MISIIINILEKAGRKLESFLFIGSEANNNLENAEITVIHTLQPEQQTKSTLDRSIGKFTLPSSLSTIGHVKYARVENVMIRHNFEQKHNMVTCFSCVN